MDEQAHRAAPLASTAQAEGAREAETAQAPVEQEPQATRNLTGSESRLQQCSSSTAVNSPSSTDFTTKFILFGGSTEA
jgi:hypothetical protein